MEITPATLAPQTAAASAEATDTGAVSSDFETFLRMLTVQMQNQDPLNPMKSEDFAVQLATFSGVEQQVRTNDLLKEMKSDMGLGGMAQAAGWVGMEARSDAGGHFDGAPLTLFPQPATGADKAVLVVKNANGTEVQRTQIAVSDNPVTWTGADPQGGQFLGGSYSFQVESYQNGALSSTAPVEVYSRITEARLDGAQTVLVLLGGAEIDASQVTGLREPANT